MKNNKKGFIQIVIIVTFLLVLGGVYLYVNKNPRFTDNNFQGTSTARESITATTSEPSSADKNKSTSIITAPKDSVITPVSIQKCEAEIKEDFSKLSFDLVQLRYIEGHFFTSQSLAQNFFISKGYNNFEGHGTIDLNESGNSTDISVAVIGLKSLFPYESGEKKGMEIKEVTQPIVCIDGKVAPKSKIFLTVTLKNEKGVRAAIYEKGERVK